jgi:hypothetical protein
MLGVLSESSLVLSEVNGNIGTVEDLIKRLPGYWVTPFVGGNRVIQKI